MMQLTDAQKEALRQWAAQGLGLSEIQKKLQEEFGLSMTYLDVRFLAIDLGLKLQEKKPTAAAQPAKPALASDEPEPAPGHGAVSVEVDRVMKPGSLVSGTVRFSDGVKATWLIDQTGRLAIAASKPGYRPPPADLRDFQEELQRVLERQGY